MFRLFDKTKSAPTVKIVRPASLAWTPSDRVELAKFLQGNTGRKLEEIITDMVLTAILDAARSGDGRMVQRATDQSFAANLIMAKFHTLGAPIPSTSEEFDPAQISKTESPQTTTMPEEQS